MRSTIILYAVKVIALLPLGAAHLLGYFIGTLFYLWPNRERRQAEINISLCLPALTSAERRRLTRRSLIESAKTLMEMPGIWMGRPEPYLRRLKLVEGASLPAQRLAEGRGLILAAPHLGAWEVGVHHLARLAPVTVLYRPPRERALESLITAGRGKGGATLVPITPAGIKALYQALERNEMVAILPDQQPRGFRGAGVFAPFFDYPALTMVLINRLARKTGAPVVFGYSERRSWSQGYLGYFLPAPEGIDSEDPVAAATALNKGVEACVRRCSEQYQWSYRRFSIQPDGGRSPYKKSIS